MTLSVLIADGFEDWGVEQIGGLGAEVTHDPALRGDALRDAVARTECTVLVVRSTQVTADIFAAAPQLGLVVRAGAGYNTIDVDAASKRGVLVANCPGKNAVAVAELTFALILALDRRIVENVNDLRTGKWNKKEYATAPGLKDRTIGLVGFGRIGQEVARRARAFDMNVVAWSRSLTPSKADALQVEPCDGPADVAARCDILSVHLAAAPETNGIINADVLGRLPKGAYVINTARQDVMDYDALAAAVNERGLRVGLDVFPGEPSTGRAEFDCAIARANGIVYGTHHIGASTKQAQTAIANETIRIIQSFAETGKTPNVVNLETQCPAKCQLVVRHFDKVGVLAGVLDKLRRAKINVEEMDNTIFKGRTTAVATIRLSAVPDDALVREIADMEDLVIRVDVKPT